MCPPSVSRRADKRPATIGIEGQRHSARDCAEAVSVANTKHEVRAARELLNVAVLAGSLCSVAIASANSGRCCQWSSEAPSSDSRPLAGMSEGQGRARRPRRALKRIHWTERTCESSSNRAIRWLHHGFGAAGPRPRAIFESRGVNRHGEHARVPVGIACLPRADVEVKRIWHNQPATARCEIVTANEAEHFLKWSGYADAFR